MTGAVRELHQQHPGQFATDVDTTFPQVWWHNPYITRLSSNIEAIDCKNVQIDRTGERGIHYVGAYLEHLNHHLGIRTDLKKVAGDIHISPVEKNWHSDIWTLCGREVPFWLICSGGKLDIPIKWWDHGRYQEIVNHFRGRIQFVQVGAWGNHHPRLEGAIDLRGATNIRDLIHLMHYARGVVCGVTSMMHLAAAVPRESRVPRGVFVVAGAREAEVWERYPGHHYFDTSSMVSCRHCWKHRHIRLEDRGGNTNDEIVCREVSSNLPRCMDLVSAREVIDKIEAFCGSHPAAVLKAYQRPFAQKALLAREVLSTFDRHNVTPLNAVAMAERAIEEIAGYPARRFSGRGIVLCGGGSRYFANAWICIKMLRFHGCSLPIEVWHLGRREMDRTMEGLLQDLGVTCVNAREVMNRYPLRNPLGWELKSYALLHSRFEEVLFLDADNVPVANPEYLFEEPDFKRTGAVFWPDFRRLGQRRAIWKVCGVRYRDEPEFESGQMLVNKRLCWRPLNLAFWYNDHSEFFFKYMHGDKETFHMAWRKLGAAYVMVPHAIHALPGTMCQHDLQGKRIFQHRNLEKWSVFSEPKRIPGFWYEEECVRFLDELRRSWDGRIGGRRQTVRRFDFEFRTETFDENIFRSVVLEDEYEVPGRLEETDTIIDVGAHIGSFSALCFSRGSRRILSFEANRENFELCRRNLARYQGVKATHAAILDVAGRARNLPFPRSEDGENTGGAAVELDSEGGVRSVSLDSILQRVGTCRLLKLDCEGSEWPILLNSRELHRVDAICGEYHAMRSHPRCEGVGELDQKLLRKVLRRQFHNVRFRLDKSTVSLGKFWASCPKTKVA